MTTYWEVETYSKKLISKREDEDGRHQEVIYSSGASNERCLLEAPAVSGNESGDYVQVDGDETLGASALSLSYDKTAHKAACLDKMKEEREPKLTASDWRVLPDSPMTEAQKTNWSTYRQELRDLPENTVDSRDFDFENDWPTEPVV